MKNIFLITVSFFVIQLAGCGKSGDSIISNDGIVNFVTGDVAAAGQGGEVRLNVNDKITAGMTVKTGVKSIAEITFQGGVIRINEKSSVVMKELAKNIRDNKEMTELFVESGQSLFKVTKKLTDGEKFNVTTATAVAAVRGTEFTVAADEKKTLIACKEGRIAVKESSADDSAFVVIGPGEEALVEEGKPVLISLTDKKVKGEIKQNDALSGTNPSAGEMKGSAKIRAEEVKGEIENK